MFDYTKIDESKVEFLEIAPASELPMGKIICRDRGQTDRDIQYCRSILCDWRYVLRMTMAR